MTPLLMINVIEVSEVQIFILLELIALQKRLLMSRTTYGEVMVISPFPYPFKSKASSVPVLTGLISNHTLWKAFLGVVGQACN